MTITKANLIDSIYNHSDLQKQDSTIIVESLLEIIKHTLETGEDVLVSGFGKFCVKEKKERRGRNPSTGNDLTLESRRVVNLKCSGKLRKKLNTKKKKGKKGR